MLQRVPDLHDDECLQPRSVGWRRGGRTVHPDASPCPRPRGLGSGRDPDGTTYSGECLVSRAGAPWRSSRRLVAGTLSADMPGRRAWRAAGAALACIAALVSVEVGGAARQSLPSFPAISPLCHRADFSSEGRSVRAALCRRPGSARLPAVVVLHGCGGFGGIDEVLARDLPSHGVATYYIDYFGLTPAPSKRGFCGSPQTERSFATWQRIVVDATATLKRMPGIDAGRVGAVGWSLGGGLALLTGEYGAGTTPLRHSPFHALVVLSAFDHGGPVGALPPTLVLSGAAATPFQSPTRGPSTVRFEARTCPRSFTSTRTGPTAGRGGSGSWASAGRSISCTATSSSIAQFAPKRQGFCRETSPLRMRIRHRR